MPINLYHYYRQEKCSPFLLESLGPHTPIAKCSVLGIRPTRKLVCLSGVLFENGQEIGKALDIFSHLDLPKSENFFPAWMGFFTYEFARHFGLPSKEASRGIPDAVFYLYEDGYLWEGDGLTEFCSFPPLEKGVGGFSIPFSKGGNNGAAFAAVRNSIVSGDVYQVNLAQRLSFDAREVDFFDLYQRLRTNNPSPFMGFIEDDDWAIASASPERLFRLHDGRISSRPIAGTRKRSANLSEDRALEEELLASPKERAEHAMLVDLVRNDLSRICEVGSVHVDEAFIVERYAHVMHLVSEVVGTTHASLRAIVEALFPAGTITGTPKESAMEHIRDLEPHARGPYTGSMGYISGRDGTDFNILIRSAFKEGDVGHIWAGAGIVAQSDTAAENSEMDCKAQSVSHVLSNTQSPSTPAFPRPGIRFSRSLASTQLARRVLFVENHDSFSHNIIDALRKLGCEVDIVDHNDSVDVDYTHVILGPGPKSPGEAGQLNAILARALQNDIAILGICLGHQALGLHFGAQLVKARRAIHGETDLLTHTGHPLFTGLPTTFQAMRYHSLVLTQIPESFQVIAYSGSDEVMAIAHKTRPWFGVQFHPESFLSEGCEQIFANFLEIGGQGS